MILSLVYVCTYGRKIGPAGYICDRCDTDTGVCTDSCKIGLEDYCDRCDTEIGVCTNGCRIVPEGNYCDICDTDTGVCTKVCKIGLKGDYCDIFANDAGVCTDGYKGTMVIGVILTPVYVQTAVK